MNSLILSLVIFCTSPPPHSADLAGTLTNHNIRPASLHWIQTSHRFWIALNNPSTDTYISGTLARGGQWEPEIVAIITKYIAPGQVFVDVGANIGYFSAVARSLGARVVSYEPVVGNYQRMVATRDRMGKPNGEWTIHNNAVSSRSGDVVYLNTADSSVNSGNFKISGGYSPHSYHATTVTLNNTIHERIRVLKIDVEGHEARVMQGAVGLTIDVIIMEITHDIMSHHSCKWRDMIHWLLSQGYRMETLKGIPVKFHNGWMPRDSNYVFIIY
jgi:FkbM family methyltransferase